VLSASVDSVMESMEKLHIAKLDEFYQQFDAAGQNPELYAQIVPPMANIFDHAAQTLEQFTGPEAP